MIIGRSKNKGIMTLGFKVVAITLICKNRYQEAGQCAPLGTGVVGLGESRKPDFSIYSTTLFEILNQEHV